MGGGKLKKSRLADGADEHRLWGGGGGSGGENEEEDEAGGKKVEETGRELIGQAGKEEVFVVEC